MEQRKKVRPREEAVELIECYIRKLDLPPRSKLPSERDMCEMWDLNRTTLRQAIRRLTEEGKLYSVKGSGTYIAAPKLERNLQDSKSTSESVRGAGHVLYSRVLDIQVLECNRYLAQMFQVPLGYKVFSLRRLRVMDGEPYMVEHSYVDYDCCAGIENTDFTTASLYHALRDRGVVMTQGSESVGITYATEEEAGLLQVEEGAPLFFLSGVNCTADGRIVEYFKSAARTDKVRFYSTLRRGKKSEAERGQAE